MTTAQSLIVLALAALVLATLRARIYFPADPWLARIFAILIVTAVAAAGTVFSTSLVIARFCGVLMLGAMAFLAWSIEQQQRNSTPSPKS